ncbi:MAG TPA: hypothetical protein VGC54_12405 [Planctomycetota bacterium]
MRLSRSARPFLPALSGAALLLLGACSALGGGRDPDGGWVSRRIEDGPPRRDLVRAAQWGLVRGDFPPGETNDHEGSVSSGWDVELAPYTNRGRRSRAVVEYEPLERPGGWEVRVRVEVDVNVEKHRTLDPVAAEWEEKGYDLERAQTVLYQILAQLGDPAAGTRGRR